MRMQTDTLVSAAERLQEQQARLALRLAEFETRLAAAEAQLGRTEVRESAAAVGTVDSLGRLREMSAELALMQRLTG